MPKSLKPVVAVITPTNNRLKLLREAVASVQAQTFDAWEHIIVDDGSQDGTPQEMAEQAMGDARIRYIQRTGETSGANCCRNIGITASDAEFIVFLDSDDVLDPDCLARRVEIMQRNADIDFATFQTGIFVETIGDKARQLDAELLGDDLLRFLYFECPWIITGPIWRRASLLRIGLFDEALLSWQDIELHVRALTAGMRYLRFPEIDHHVRWQFEETKVSVEQRRSPRHLNAALNVVEKFERLVRDGPGMNWNRQRAICGLYFFTAESWVNANHPSKAQSAWRRIRDRSLGTVLLYLSGAALLAGMAASLPIARLVHKWKGWMRLRSQPELVS